MANLQHQNGISEAMVKFSKAVLKSLLAAIGREILNLNELNNLLAKATSLINDCLIGIKPNKRVDRTYLLPNSLLLGWSVKKIGQGPFQLDGENVEDPNKFNNRFLFVQALTEQFWCSSGETGSSCTSQLW